LEDENLFCFVGVKKVQESVKDLFGCCQLFAAAFGEKLKERLFFVYTREK
jgi:hypothetical protein